MTDIVDDAQAREEQQREEALRRHRRVTVYGPGSAKCKSCGEKIDAARRKAVPGARRCTFCQEQAESGRA